MRINIPYWRQRSDFTCDPAVLMMAMKFFKPKLKLSKELEFEIWRESYGIGISGCMPQGLAVSALNRGFHATMICRKVGWFECSRKIAKNGTKWSQETTILTSKSLFKKAKKLGMDVIDRDPGIKDIEDAIRKRYVPLIMINAGVLYGDDSPHWVVVTGIEGKKAWINDPIGKKIAKNYMVSVRDLEKMINDLKTKSRINKRILIVSR